MVELNVPSDIFYLYCVLILIKCHQLFSGNFEILISSLLCIICNIMERRNFKKLRSVKFSLYEKRSGSPRRRRARTVFTTDQLEKLENQFQVNPYTDPYTLEMMSIKLDLDVDPIKVWFKNRRRREKAINKQEMRSTKINPSNKKRPAVNKQIGMIKSKQQNDPCKNVIRNDENFNANEVKTKNLASQTKNWSLIPYSHGVENNIYNRNNNNEGLKAIYIEPQLYALYNANNNFAPLYSDYSSPFYNGNYLTGIHLSNPCAGGFFSNYFSANNLQELAYLLN